MDAFTVMVAKTLTNLTTMKMKLGLNASKVALLVSLWLIVLATFFAAFIGLAIFGYVAGKKQQDPTLEIANQIAQDPEALKQLLESIWSTK